MEVKTPKRSMDGFVPRRPQRVVLGEKSGKTTETNIGHRRDHEENTEGLHTGDANHKLHLQTPAEHGNSLKDSISSSLQAIDETAIETPRQKRKKQRKKTRKIKIASLIIVGILLLGGGWLVYKAWVMGSQIFANGNILDLFQQHPLKKDAFGRSNVLVVGSTDDDPDHPGSTLTDSMMVISVSQEKKDAYIFSIPRDLYVQFDRACISGYAGKINEYYGCVDSGEGDQADKARMDGARKFIGKIFDMDIQYVAHINTMVIKDSINAVGGVTVDVQSRDPRGVLDTSMDWMCWASELSYEQRQKRCPTGHYIDLKNGPNEMDGDKAMWFSRARGLTAPTYGLEQSNFDREKNQQAVLMALKNKAMSTGTLTDIGKITGLMDAMGKNLRSNVEPKEVRTIMDLASKMDENSMHQLTFVEEDKELMTTGLTPNGASIVHPVAGLYDYSKIIAYLKNTIYATPVSKEKARVVVLNGGAVEGAAGTRAEEFSKLGMDVVLVSNTPEDHQGKSRIYQVVLAEEKTATRAKIEEIMGMKVNQSALPFEINVEADFVVVVGSEN